MDGFNNFVLTETDDYWKLDDELLEIIVEINKSKCIQTLNSKWWKAGSNTLSRISFLRFCYSENQVRVITENIIPYLNREFNKNDKEIFNYVTFPPMANVMYNSESKIKLPVFTDANYYMINSIRLEVNSWQQEHHNKFWSILRLLLSAME